MLKPTDPLTKKEREFVEQEAQFVQARAWGNMGVDLDLDTCRAFVLQRMLEKAVDFEVSEFHRMTGDKYR